MVAKNADTAWLLELRIMEVTPCQHTITNFQLTETPLFGIISLVN